MGARPVAGFDSWAVFSRVKDGTMHEVSVQQSAARTIAAVHARLAVATVPASFSRYLDQVYAAGKSGVVGLDGQNVFIYRPVAGHPDDALCSFGVGVTSPF